MWRSRGNNKTTGKDNDGQHTHQSHRMWYRLKKDGGGDCNDGELGKCEGTIVGAVGVCVCFWPPVTTGLL